MLQRFFKNFFWVKLDFFFYILDLLFLRLIHRSLFGSSFHLTEIGAVIPRIVQGFHCDGPFTLGIDRICADGFPRQLAAFARNSQLLDVHII